MTTPILARSVEYVEKFFVTGVFSGYLPLAPGSWGSLLACILLWLFFPRLWYWQLLVIILFCPIAVFFAGRGLKHFGPDGRPIVIDEMMGQAVALFMVPRIIFAYFLAFLLFRIFDVTKPQPARKWEKIRGGAGVVADDIAAGVYAAVTVQVVIEFLRRWGAYGV